MKKIVFLGLAVLVMSTTSCTQFQTHSTTIVERDFLDFEPSQQILQFEDMRDGYYLQFANNPVDTREWCQDTLVEQKQLIVGVNSVSRICLEADNRYYLD